MIMVMTTRTITATIMATTTSRGKRRDTITAMVMAITTATPTVPAMKSA